MTGYDFHPEARRDLDEIWEYIAADNFDAAYATDEKPLWVLAVMHGRGNPRVLAAADAG